MAGKQSIHPTKSLPECSMQSRMINGKNDLSLLTQNTVILHVECLIGDEGVDALTHSLIRLQRLTTLDLTIRRITDRGIENFSNFIANSIKVTSLFLRFNAVSKIGAEHLGKALRSNKNLVEFGIECIQCDLIDYIIGGEGAVHITNSLAYNSVKVLSLLQCDIDDEHFKEIVRGFSKSCHLSYVNLSRNRIGSKSLILLGDHLTNISNLSILILDSNVQTDHLGMSALFHSFINNNTLKQLSVKSCQIHPTSLSYLGKLLTENSTLRVLNLAGNSGLSEEGARMLSRGLENNSVLQALDVSYCNLSEDAVARITLALKSNSRLNKLYLDYNQIMLGALHEIAETLTHNKSLKLLSLLGCPVNENAMWVMLQALNANNTLEILRLDKTQDRSDQLYDLFLEILLKKNKKIAQLSKMK
ncbi:Protein NLRC3-like [Oopsacas minuta]|uniref:Protein NLRC3-like n=1 Tax=Oopsacas minuta TaxID=111878 RepID=A0AAV7KJ83_9METZ|nr:Protein NLRC3-like [Oopsacas minuta]